jgi:tripartite-type tricarboxylate transporter receptor subunit TctC
MAGQVALFFNTVVGLSPHIRSGRMRLLATCGETRSTSYPETPTMAESGLRNVVVTGWGGFLAPAGTPREAIAKFQSDAASALQGKELHERLTAIGTEPAPSTPEQFEAFLRSETEKWGAVAKRAGIYRSQ